MDEFTPEDWRLTRQGIESLYLRAMLLASEAQRANKPKVAAFFSAIAAEYATLANSVPKMARVVSQ